MYRFYFFLIVLFVGCITVKKEPSQPVGILPRSNSIEAKIDSFITTEMKTNHIPGLSLAVVKEGQVIYAKGYGMSNLELSTPATEKTAFSIYSITKTFTAVATMMLVQDGKLALEDPIIKYFPDVPNTWHTIKIGHLLNHSSGLREICRVPQNPCFTVNNYTKENLIPFLRDFPLDFNPGEKAAYGNTAYLLLGMLIEKITGKKYDEFLQERIFKPLGMTDSGIDNFLNLIPNRADGYTWRNGGYKNAHRVSPSLSFSAAGLISTVLDLAKYDAALYTDQLLKKSTLKQMWTNNLLTNGEVSGFGLGFGLTPYKDHRRVGHSGGHTGFTTALSRFIDDKISVVILTNSDADGHTRGNGFLINALANEIASFYFEKK